ncbi:hypothetical protein ACT3UD_15240 [Glutamicibacter sp. 287]|nr:MULTISPECIES: hypothetical protein [Micrococcaceae]
MTDNDNNQNLAKRPSNIRKQLRNLALLALGVAIAYVVTNFLR